MRLKELEKNSSGCSPRFPKQSASVRCIANMGNICKLTLSTFFRTTEPTYRNSPIPRDELFDEILEPMYRAECVQPILKSVPSNLLFSSFESIKCIHVLGVLFAVFSLGALLDTDRQPFSVESQEYCYLARVALSSSHQVTRMSILGFVRIYKIFLISLLY